MSFLSGLGAAPRSVRSAGSCARSLVPMPQLDGVRALAILLVVFHHLKPRWLPGGFIGVDVFFVLSGFLITVILINEMESERGFVARNFFLRRGRRLLPALLTLLTVYTVYILVATTGSWRLTSLETVVVAATYVINLVGAAGHDVPWQMDHLWSLAVEAQFYLIWPFVLWSMLRRRLSHHTILRITVGLAAASALIRAAFWLLSHDPSLPYQSTASRVDGVLLGSALGMTYAWRLRERRLRAVVVGSSWQVAVAVAALVVAAFTLKLTTGAAYYGGIAAAVLLTAVLLVHLTTDTTGVAGWPRKVFASRPLRYLGTRSYSVYIWQNPVAWALTGPLRHSALWLPANLAITWGCAEMSYRFVERPFLTQRRRTAMEPVRVAGGSRDADPAGAAEPAST